MAVPRASHKAKRQTAEVTMTAMRMGNKHMTLSVFRQLPYRTIINTQALLCVATTYPSAPPLLLSQPWGHVNYVWDGWCPDREYYKSATGQANLGRLGARLHVAWEAEGQLYRAAVYEHVPDWVAPWQVAHGHTARQAVTRAVWAQCWKDLQALPQLFIAT